MSHPRELPEPDNPFAGVQILYILKEQEYSEDSKKPLSDLLYAYSDRKRLVRHIEDRKKAIVENYKEKEWDNSEAEWKSSKIEDVTFEEANKLEDGRSMWIYSVWVLEGPNQEAGDLSKYY